MKTNRANKTEKTKEEGEEHDDATLLYISFSFAHTGTLHLYSLSTSGQRVCRRTRFYEFDLFTVLLYTQLYGYDINKQF